MEQQQLKQQLIYHLNKEESQQNTTRHEPNVRVQNLSTITFRKEDQIPTKTLFTTPFMTHIHVTLQAELVSDFALMLQKCSRRATQYTLFNKLVHVKNFRHTLIIYRDFIILCLSHLNVYCNFNCKYVLSSRILSVTHFADMAVKMYSPAP